MRETDTFYPIIHRVAEVPRMVASSQKVVAIDRRRRQPMEINWFVQLNPLVDAEYYLVSNSKDPRNVANGHVPIKLGEGVVERPLGLTVTYSGSCVPGNEERLALALFGGSRPKDIFDNHLRTWVAEFTSRLPGVGEFIDQFFSRKGELSAFITDRARSEIGLTLRVEALPDGGAAVKRNIDVELKDLAVRLKDSDRGQQLSLTTQLVICESTGINAYLYHLNDQRWIEWVRETVQKYLVSNVSLDEFCTGLNRGPVWEGLKKYLDAGLKPAGRQLAFLILDGKWDHVREFYEAHIDVPYTIQGHIPVVIKCTAQMICRNRALYLNSGAPAPEEWLSTNIREVVSLTLFGKKYIDLLLKFQSLEKDIKNKLSFRVASIGFDIQQLISIPDLEEYLLLDNFDIEIDDEFTAKPSSSTVKLKLVVTARIKDLQDVSQYLNRGQNVREKMTEAIFAATRQLLHTIDLARYYTRFDFTDVPGEEPVTKLLEDNIRTALTQQFNAEISKFIADIPETPFDEIWPSFKRISEFKVTLSRSRNLGSVALTGDFQVRSIHPAYWERSQTMNLDLDEIRGQLEKNLLSELETVPAAILVREATEKPKAIINWAGELAKVYVLNTYGLVIEVSNVRCRAAGPDFLNELFEQELEADVSTEKLRIDLERKLKQDRIKLITDGAPGTLIEQIEERIKTVQAARGEAGPTTIEVGKQISASVDLFTPADSSAGQPPSD